MRLRIIIISILVSITGLAIGQPSKEDRKKAREAMKTYMEENVLPVMKPIRENFDSYLSANEKAELAEVRAILQSKREEMKGKKEELKEFRNSDERPSEAQREEFRKMRNEHRKLMTRVWAIADNHEDKLEEIRTELKPKMETWREEMRSIMEENRPENPEKGKHHRKGSRMEGRGHGPKGQGHRGPHQGGLGKIATPVGFLLWDPAQSPEPVSVELKTYPNPTSAISNLEYTVKEASQVTIKLIDEQGLTLKTLVDEYLEAGTYDLQTNLQELKKGLYFYQIQTEGGITTQKILID